MNMSVVSLGNIVCHKTWSYEFLLEDGRFLAKTYAKCGLSKTKSDCANNRNPEEQHVR